MIILQWNCRILKSKWFEIQKHIHNYDIALLSEIWLTLEDNITLRNFDIIRKDRMGRRGGGVAILIRSSIKYSKVDIHFDCHGQLEICAIKIFDSVGDTLLVSCYRAPDSQRINSIDWNNFFSQFDGRTIVGGDFNAHHSLWGDSRDCQVGLDLVNGILDSNFICLNTGCSTYVSSIDPGVESSVDLTFSNANQCLNFEWRVGDDMWGSDHLPIDIFLDVKS